MIRYLLGPAVLSDFLSFCQKETIFNRTLAVFHGSNNVLMDGTVFHQTSVANNLNPHPILDSDEFIILA